MVTPTEENGFSLFQQQLEENPLVYFHATPRQNYESIVNFGFKSSASLVSKGLESVTYAKQSSSCLANEGNSFQENYVVFAVEFAVDFYTLDQETLNQQQIVTNPSDIHVYSDIQPSILGYCEIPAGFRLR